VTASAACAVNPVTGERELALISEDQEIALGRDGAQQAAASIGLVDDEGLQSYVSAIGKELAATSERPALPWEFRVVDDPSPNAFALPGGYIFVTRGLLSIMGSEAELAAVLGHEIGHVTARHSVAQVSRAQLAQIGLNLGMILAPELQGLGGAAGAGLQLLFLKYGRDDERQADELGFRYMLDHGYDVNEMDDVFAALQQSGALAGQTPVPGWLASHPSEPERIDAVRARIAATPLANADFRIDADEYLDQIDGLVYGADPRNGFFRDGRFYHPELIFQIEVPENWQKQNLAQQMVAISPEQDAAMQLSIVPNQGPQEAARAFLTQQGVAGIASAPQRVNGNAGVVSEFQAQAQSGVVRGYVSHISHGGATYQIVAYAPGARFNQRARELESIVESFAPLQDQAVLHIQPRRIDIEPLPSAMSLAELQRTRPSSVSIEELAVINQIEDVNAVLPRGTPVKRVTGERIG
jgi:predicted Zn-dependent protease